MTVRRLLILALLALTGGAALVVWWTHESAAPSYAITNADFRGDVIVAFGDSLTQGVGASTGQSYPEVLGTRLQMRIINKGVGGDTTDDGLRRLESDVLAQKPGVVLLGLGGNDFLRRQDVEKTFGNLETIIRKLQERGALVIVLGLEVPMASSAGRRYRELAEKMGCPYVPNMLGGILGREELMHDAIHPNGAGYVKVVDKIEPVIRKVLKKGGPEGANR